MCNTKLTKKDIQKLENGDIPDSIIDKPFVIIRQSVKMMVLPDTIGWEWQINFSPSKDDVVDISRETAKEIIRANNMTLAHSMKCGQIYELPGNPFLKTFKNTFNKFERADRKAER